MKSLRLTVKGLVQKVGYRNQVYLAARKLKVKGYVKNLNDEDDSVEVLAQHKDGKVLDEFIERIRIRDGLIEVEEIIREDVEMGAFPKFKRVLGSYEEENAERLDTAAYHLSGLTHEVRAHREETHAGFASLGSKMDVTNRKLDSANGKLESANTKLDVANDKLDSANGKLDSTNAKLGESNQKLDSFSENTSSRFDVVDTKYGKISDKLERISGSLDELVSILRQFAPQK